MDKVDFLKDLEVLYKHTLEQKNNLNVLFEQLKNGDKIEIIESFVDFVDLKSNDELKLVLVTRLVMLKDEPLIQYLKTISKTKQEIVDIKEKAYEFVNNFYIKYHEKTIDFIEQNKLLTPFYVQIIKSVHKVGILMSQFNIAWNEHIINNINLNLEKEFDNDKEKILEFLKSNNLLELDENDNPTQKSYSTIVQIDDKFEVQTYAKVFQNQVSAIVFELEEFEESLIELEDETYGQKWEYIQYIQSLALAFGEMKTNKLKLKWQKVDEAWMSITTPIQIGHPFEYYEDHYRKCVAPEWDIRISNPTMKNDTQILEDTKTMFELFYAQVDTKNEHKDLYDFSLGSLNKVGLYLGQPLMYYGAEINGMFSAQVVPNDEDVSKIYGKKIFAFADEILQSQRAKPFTMLSAQIFPTEFITKNREFLFNSDDDWHKVYSISTIGHEYGHILWSDLTSEIKINKTGNYKNIEEFKATSSGLMAYFTSPYNKELEYHVISDVVTRSIGLIGYMHSNEIQPYYCEGLIHLDGLFESGVLTFNTATKKLDIKINEQTTQFLKQWYVKTYTSLATHYLEKEDATIWLNQYAIEENDAFMPKKDFIKEFVVYYYDLYKKFGNKIDKSIDKSQYIIS